MTDEKTPSVFISHSSKDSGFSNKLADALKAAGIETWIDNYELHVGEDIYKYIGDAIGKANHFAVVLSAKSIASDWVIKELHAALALEAEGKTKVIPIVIEQIEIPVFLKAKLYSDFSAGTDFTESFETLLKSITKGTVPAAAVKGVAQLYPDRFLPDLRFFTGRVDLLDAIRETLDADHRAVLHDISGLGKTFTAYKYAYDNKKGYDRIFLVRATKEEWLESLAKNGEVINPSLAALTEQEAKARGFKDWLERNKNWLVIYDNVDLPEQLFDFVPVTENGECLFTSNYPDAIMLGTQVGIEKMKDDEAASLLFCRSVGDPRAVLNLEGKELEAFENLLKEIDGLPVTLTSTGAVIFKKKWTFERFWKEYNETPSIAWESEDPYGSYQNKSAGRIFSLIYDELTKDRKIGKAVKIILDSVSFISPDEIPEELLKTILEYQYAPYSEGGNSDNFWDDVRDKLTSYDALKYDRSKGIFTTHRAIQKVIQSRNKISQEDICIALAAVLWGLFPLYTYSNRADCEKYYQHVLVLVTNADRRGIENEHTNSLYFRLGRYQLDLGNPMLAENFNVRSAEISGNVFGEESINHAINLNDLGVVYNRLGKYDEAAETLKGALRISEKKEGSENETYASFLSNLAPVYINQGNYDEAIKIFEIVLGLREKLYGKGHEAYARTLNNLGDLYRKQKRYDEAIDKFEEALRIAENSIGLDHPDISTISNNLGVTYFSLGAYEKAIEKHKESLRIDENTIGQKHPNYALHLSNLAAVYERRADYKRALEMYEEALRIDEKTLPLEHPHAVLDRKSVERCRKLVEGNS